MLNANENVAKKAVELFEYKLIDVSVYYKDRSVLYRSAIVTSSKQLDHTPIS